jgi:hypothetical protein
MGLSGVSLFIGKSIGIHGKLIGINGETSWERGISWEVFMENWDPIGINGKLIGSNRE